MMDLGRPLLDQRLSSSQTRHGVSDVPHYPSPLINSSMAQDKLPTSPTSWSYSTFTGKPQGTLACWSNPPCSHRLATCTDPATQQLQHTRLQTRSDPAVYDQPQTRLGQAEAAFGHARHASGLALARYQLSVNSDVCSGRLFHHTNNTDYPHWARDYLGTTAKP